MRSSIERSKKYSSKLVGDISKQRLDSYGKTQKQIFKTSIPKQVEIEQKVKAYMAQQGLSSMLTNYYILFAKNMANPSDVECNIEFNKWAARNLSWYHLRNMGRFIFNRRLDLKSIDTDPAMVLHHTFYSGGGTRVNDLSGTNNYGTLSGATLPVWTTDGLLGNAVLFDGIDDRSTVLDNATIKFGLTDFSIFCWLRTASAASKDIIEKGAAGKYYDLRVHTGGVFRAMLYDGAMSVSRAGTTVINDNAWHFVGVTVNRSGNLVIYVDGAQEGTPASTAGLGDISSTANMLMCYSPLTAAYLAGTLDEVKIFSRVLTAAEILNMYNAEKPFYI